MAPSVDKAAEWLETDGLGGFASGTVGGIRTRRYHALLNVARTPPTRRCVLVNGLDVFLATPARRFALSSQRYEPDVVHPDGQDHLEAFATDPWPTWTFRLDDTLVVEQEVFVPEGQAAAVIVWRIQSGGDDLELEVRPFLSGRDHHHLLREQPHLSFDAEIFDGAVRWRPQPGMPAVVALHNGAYVHDPHWYRSFRYEQEALRGFDHVEDLASPGVLRFDLAAREAVCILAADLEGLPSGELAVERSDAERLAWKLREAERARREAFATPLHRAARQYVVERADGRSIIAGYPWFTDWGRDTFIALRGLCLATGDLEDAGAVLRTWAQHVSEGMIPNRFPDQDGPAEYNAADASLWFIVAAHDYLDLAARNGVVPDGGRGLIEDACRAILEGYAGGTRHHIGAAPDGLLAAGEPGVQLTWMDAKVGDHVVTARSGKPVELQALWINALEIGAAWNARWGALARKARATFVERFWSEERGHLLDVVDVDHVPDAIDPTFRPNQVLAVGGLPFPLLEGTRARRLIDQVEARLWTPLGLRTLAPDEPGYCPRYEGSPFERDCAYHQGTVWPWLIGPFVEAWVRARGGGATVRAEARRRFLEPFETHLREAGLGHVSEIADADPPHRPQGCPFQAWSLGELLRLEEIVLKEPVDARAR